MKHKLGVNSNEKLNTCHQDFQKIIRLAISRSKVDFGVSEGHRAIERQHKLFLEGKSKIDGYTKKGKHNYKPSLAGDIYAYHPNRKVRERIIYDPLTLSYIAGVIDSCAQELYSKKEITHLIRWGGNWDSDGIIKYDQRFNDLPHFELIKPKK